MKLKVVVYIAIGIKIILKVPMVTLLQDVQQQQKMENVVKGKLKKGVSIVGSTSIIINLKGELII